MAVIGCVWGAWRALVEQLWAAGDEAPTYEWCEAEWHRVLRARKPADSYVPEWLRMELWSRWRIYQAQGRTFTPADRQLSLWEA